MQQFLFGVLHCGLTSIWLCFLPGFLMLIVGDSHTGNTHQLQYASKLVMSWLNTFFMRNSSQKLVLNVLTNYNRNMLGYCSHNSREQMKNPETFSNEAQPEFFIETVFLVMTNTKYGIFRHFHPLSGNNCPKC